MREGLSSKRRQREPMTNPEPFIYSCIHSLSKPFITCLFTNMLTLNTAERAIIGLFVNKTELAWLESQEKSQYPVHNNIPFYRRLSKDFTRPHTHTHTHTHTQTVMWSYWSWSRLCFTITTFSLPRSRFSSLIQLQGRETGLMGGHLVQQ